MLTTFDSHSFFPHGILPAFPVQLGGKTTEVDVEVVDATLDYNLLLGRKWTYAMIAIISSVFHTLCFPHDGKIMNIDKCFFAYASPNAYVGPSIPVINNYHPTNENVGVIMYSSLMGTFDFMTLVHHIYTMSSRSACQRGLFLSEIHILTILRPYLP
jgi:hypothetical protein